MNIDRSKGCSSNCQISLMIYLLVNIMIDSWHTLICQQLMDQWIDCLPSAFNPHPLECLNQKFRLGDHRGCHNRMHASSWDHQIWTLTQWVPLFSSSLFLNRLRLLSKNGRTWGISGTGHSLKPRGRQRAASNKGPSKRATTTLSPVWKMQKNQLVRMEDPTLDTVLQDSNYSDNLWRLG